MELNHAERDLLLAALFELRLAHEENTEERARIEALVVKLGGDPDTGFFGAYRHPAQLDAPVPEYPADETDEG